MRMLSSKGFALVLITVSVFCTSTLFAQKGTSSSSVSRNRDKSKVKRKSASSASVSRNRNFASTSASGYYRSSNTFVAPDEVAVEEFINYHKHDLPMPRANESVALDMRFGNNEISDTQNEAILQVGWTTPNANDRVDLQPINLSLVIDKSGSMSSDRKMQKVKESLITMVNQLRPDDYVSIVVFDTRADVLCPSMRVGNGRRLKRAINSIAAAGSTNLHDGLMLGYREAQKYYEENATNRVILLTDGIANVGTTNPRTIAIESSEFNGLGIDLSTIGVGKDLDNNLLRTLSKQGRGLYHFVADAHDINKVFVDEVQSLISPVARRVNLSIEFDPSLEIEGVYGYEPRLGRNKISIQIDDMNSGLTQLAMIKFRVKDSYSDRARYEVRAKLTYFDLKKQTRVTKYATENLFIRRHASRRMLVDSMVRKNFTIAEIAQSIYDMSEAAKRRNYRTAERFLNQSVSTAYRRYPNMEDKDIRFILKIAKDYQNNLKGLNKDHRHNLCDGCN